MRPPQTLADDAIQINPAWLNRASYTAFLNQGFAGKWDAPAYDWYVARGFNAQPSDLLVRCDGTRVLSGMTLCYRQVAVGSGAMVEVAILSAGTTLVAERGRGHYSAMLQSALKRCREKGCAAALGFVTSDNISGHGLMRLGARSIPSFYLISPERPRAAQGLTAAPRRLIGSRPHRRHRSRKSAVELFARHRAQSTSAPGMPHAHFHYERPEDWHRQFLDRPHTVRIVRLAQDSYAALEAVDDTDRLQLLVCPDHKRAGHIAALAATSTADGRRFFMYTLDPGEAAAARRAGLRIRDGYLMLQPTGLEGGGWERLVGANWRVQSGDRM
jgi:hypothetical protein